MRLPPDTVLVCGPGAPPELAAVWRDERLPILPGEDLEAALDALGATTLVVADDTEAAVQAAALGCRVFWVGAEAPPGVRASTLAEALAAGRNARARERWKAARVS
jgi:hypothetical protein